MNRSQNRDLSSHTRGLTTKPLRLEALSSSHDTKQIVKNGKKFRRGALRKLQKALQSACDRRTVGDITRSRSSSCKAKAERMANQQASDNYSGKFPDFVPFLNFVELIQQNSKLSTTLQALGKEWSEFVQARLREDSQLLRTLGECRELPSMQRAYMRFWEKALSQYEEETQRLMRITQGAVEDATHTAQGAVVDATQTAQEAQGPIEATNGNADGRGASSSSSPSPTKRAIPSRRDSA